MSFKDALDSIKNGISDLAQLNVRTFTGEIEATVDSLPGKDVRLPEFLRAANTGGKIEVVGFTDMKIDGDIDQFITSKPFASAIAAHNTAVQVGQQSRKATVDLFLGAIRDGIKKETGDG